MKKILVLGAMGMAGHVIKTYLEETGALDVWGIARGDVSGNNMINMDVSDVVSLENLLTTDSFEVVINCIGILNKDAEDNPHKAIWYNSYLPHLLENWGKVYHFRLIHISTDCVFSGKGNGSYTEDSAKDGIGFYAQSKALGEVINEKDITIRTSIVGPALKQARTGLFHWFMQLQPGTSVKGFSRAFWSGVTTMELAKAVFQSIKQELTGLYQLTNNEKISKFDLISLFNEQFRQGSVNIEANSDYSVDKSLLNTRTDFNFTVPSYKDMVKDMYDWMQAHPDFYAIYK